jgi:hypothetical protein
VKRKAEKGLAALYRSSRMDASSLAASWLSFVVTAVGLGGLITQANAINEQLDPFHASRTAGYLGIWFQRQAAFPWWRITKPPPQGPIVMANMLEGFCGTNAIHIARIPFVFPGKAGWSLMLSMFHTEAPESRILTKLSSQEKVIHPVETAPLGSNVAAISDDKVNAEIAADWDLLPKKALTRHQSSACIVISRTTLVTILVMTNARPVFQYSDATGFRAGYASYCGQWCKLKLFPRPPVQRRPRSDLKPPSAHPLSFFVLVRSLCTKALLQMSHGLLGKKQSSSFLLTTPSARLRCFLEVSSSV